VFEDPKWDFRTLNFDRDVAFGDEKAGPVLNSTSPDLRSFRAAGGKLIQYHGWGDAAIAPASSIEYYEKVGSFMRKYPDARNNSSRPVDSFYRLFMVPGMDIAVAAQARTVLEMEGPGRASIRTTIFSPRSNVG